MTLEEKLQFCKVCLKRKMDMNVGLVCRLTNEKPAWEEKCHDFEADQAEVERLAARQQAIEEEDAASGEFFAPEKAGIQKGVVGGIIMIVIAVVWFFVGLSSGVIFYYPPVLLVIGIYALIKGAMKGNVAGEKRN